jgi:Gpi18-like mannosyltransferase
MDPIGTAMTDQTNPLKKLENNKAFTAIVVATWILMALVLRYIFFPVESYDMRGFLEPWYDFFVAHGQFKAFEFPFYDYAPGYMYLISLSTFFTWIPKIAAIKIISILFDFSAAFVVFKIIKHQKQNIKLAWFGFVATLYLPTIFVQSGMWGQCDIIFTSFLLWMMYALLRNQNIKAVLFLAIAIAFKAQAMFIAPLILVLFLTRKVRWYWLLLIPGVYILSIVPAWLAGRPFMDLLTIYFSQVSVYKLLSLSAPNFYYFFEDPKYYSTFAVAIGLVVASTIGCIYLFLRWRKYPRFTSLGYLYDASAITFLFPFVLPLMHDRYFFIAATMLFVLAFLDRKAIVPAVLIQVTSIISYFARLHFLMPVAIVINTGIAVWLVVVFWRHLKVRPDESPIE